MIDINLIRENSELVKENIKKKFQNDKLPLVDEIIELDKKWRKLRYEEDELRKQRNIISEKINRLKKAKKNADKEISKAKKIPGEIEKIGFQRKELEGKIRELMYKIPNIIDKSVPIGKDESQNVVIKNIVKPKTLKYEIINHAELAEKINGVDFDSARETSGNGFCYLTGDLALLHSALLSFARDYMVKRGFIYVIPPFMIRKKIIEGVMTFADMNDMMYKIDGEDMYLIGTSEHSMIGRFIDQIIQGDNLPFTLTSYSPCFRKEVGAHGIEEKGFYRMHQFEKQEMIVLCKPEESSKWYDQMLKINTDFFKQLGIPFRILECCSGDLGDLKSKSCDIEAWSPRQKKYYEVGSLSNLTDSQSRRLNIRVVDKTERYFPHTLNSTVIASPRFLIAILENNQNKDRSINIPKVLQKYVGGKKVIKLKSLISDKKKLK